MYVTSSTNTTVLNWCTVEVESICFNSFHFMSIGIATHRWGRWWLVLLQSVEGTRKCPRVWFMRDVSCFRKAFWKYARLSIPFISCGPSIRSQTELVGVGGCGDDRAGGHRPPDGGFGGIYVNTTHAKVCAVPGTIHAHSSKTEAIFLLTLLWGTRNRRRTSGCMYTTSSCVTWDQGWMGFSVFTFLIPYANFSER